MHSRWQARARILTAALAASVLLAAAVPAAAKGRKAIRLAEVTEAKINVGSAPDWLTSDGTALWVKRDTGEVVRIDPATNTVTASTEVFTRTLEDNCQGIGFGDGAIWTCRGGDIVRVDPATATVVTSIPVDKGDPQGQLAVLAGRVWVLTGADSSTLVGIGTATNAVETTVALGTPCNELTVGFDAVWVACAIGSVLRVDPIATTVTATVPNLRAALSITAATDAIFVGYERGVARIDPESATVTGRAKAPPGIGASITATADAVWLRSKRPSPFLRKIDPESMKVVATVTAKTASGGSVFGAFGSLWTSTYDDSFVYRLGAIPPS